MIIFLIGSLPFISIDITSGSDAPSEYDLLNATPVGQKISLLVDGSVTPQWVNFSSEWTYITELTYAIHWSDNDVEWDEFGADVELTNGIIPYYNDVALETIKNLENFLHYSSCFSFLQDDKVPKHNALIVTVHYDELLPYGLNGTTSIGYYITEDLTASGYAIDELTVTARGWVADLITSETTTTTETTGIETGITIPITTNEYFVEYPDFYHLGAKDSVRLRKLQTDQKYMLRVGSNFESDYYVDINFTAQSNIVEVDFKITDIPFESKDLSIALYKIDDSDTILLETTHCQIITSEENISSAAIKAKRTITKNTTIFSLLYTNNLRISITIK